MYRHPRVKAPKNGTKKETARNRRNTHRSSSKESEISPEDDWESLPPLSELEEAAYRFVWISSQLGFLPKHQFMERLRKEPLSVNLFLLLGIISISARITPSLMIRYGSGTKAADYFIERTATLATREIYKPPTLERCQAFYLLSVAQQCNGIEYQSQVSSCILHCVIMALTLNDKDQPGSRDAAGNAHAASPRRDLPCS